MEILLGHLFYSEIDIFKNMTFLLIRTSEKVQEKVYSCCYSLFCAISGEVFLHCAEILFKD